MAIQGVSGITGLSSCSASKIDEEEQMILRKLAQYGYKGTGKKNIDKAKLHEIEVEKVKQEKEITDGKFLTVSKKEQEKIHEKQHKPKENAGLDKNTDPKEMTGATAYGEQMFLALQMKNKQG